MADAGQIENDDIFGIFSHRFTQTFEHGGIALQSIEHEAANGPHKWIASPHLQRRMGERDAIVAIAVSEGRQAGRDALS